MTKNFDLFEENKTFNRNDLTQSHLKHFFSYNELTGDFVHLRGVCKGSIVGSLSHGYLKTKFLGHNYLVHRLIWLYVFANFPSGVIDHIDGNPLNNGILNLRDVSLSGNAQNIRKPLISNSVGFLGVRKYIRNGVFLGYRAEITVDNKKLFLGHFKSAQQASDAYITAKRIYHPTCTI